MLTIPVRESAMLLQRPSLPTPALGTAIQLCGAVPVFLSHLAGMERAV